MNRICKVLLSAFIVLYLIVLSRSAFIVLYQINESKAKILQLREQLNRLRKENKNLEEEIYRLKYDDKYIEILVREELGWTKPGEILCIPTQSH
ncbi:septum formation initiator family protein [bacterium]|nr:septum formation initiator family protein [bacterium]